MFYGYLLLYYFLFLAYIFYNPDVRNSSDEQLLISTLKIFKVLRAET